MLLAGELEVITNIRQVDGRVSGLTLRQSGFAYLLNPVTFAEYYAMPRLIVASPAQTLASLQAHPHLFGAVVMAYFLQLLGDIATAWGLYVLLAPVNRAISLLASWLQLIFAAMTLAALVNLTIVYRLLFVPEYAGLFSPSALAAQVRMLIGGYRAGWSLALVLFGLHLIVTGVLFARSTYLPRWLGWILVADGTAWVVDRLTEFVAPSGTLAFLNVFFVGELLLMGWLLGWGWRLADSDFALSPPLLRS
jgi:hypothetical protein